MWFLKTVPTYLNSNNMVTGVSAIGTHLINIKFGNMSTTSLSEQTLDAITVSARAQADQLRNATRGRALAVSRFALRPSASPVPKASAQGHRNGVSGPVDSAVLH